MSSTPTRRRTTEDDITNEVLRRFEGTEDPRLREIMQSLVRHLHGFVKDVNLTEEEWFKGIMFLTDTGQMCSDVRQEFILLSDTLGVSMVVDLINHRKPDGATESTVFGPFHRDGVADVEAGANIAPRDTSGQPLVISGRVLDLDGKPIKGAALDVWQSDSKGFYDQQLPPDQPYHMRGIFHTDADGRYLIRTTRPVAYTIPDDGPVGKMLKATKRHQWRPAHVHFVVSASGFEPVTTHIFDSVDKYLESDTVFAVKESLICDFKEHAAPDDTAKQAGVTGAYASVDFDFVLKKKA
jgi:protocatechuate 3,4-dioxygenase beta subunit